MEYHNSMTPITKIDITMGGATQIQVSLPCSLLSFPDCGRRFKSDASAKVSETRMRTLRKKNLNSKDVKTSIKSTPKKGVSIKGTPSKSTTPRKRKVKKEKKCKFFVSNRIEFKHRTFLILSI